MRKPTWTVRYYIGGTENREHRDTLAYQTHKAAHEAAREIRRGGREAEVWRTDILKECDSLPPIGERFSPGWDGRQSEGI